MDDETDETPADDSPKAETEDAADAETEELKHTETSRARSPLSRETDFIERPGFRNPANARSKALKAKKKAKKRR